VNINGQDVIVTHIALGIVINNEGKVLIIRRVHEETSSGATLRWAFPGGELHEAEPVFSTVSRETLEETGYEVAPTKLISERVHPQFPVHIYYVACDCTATPAGSVDKDEVAAVLWVPPEELGNYFTTDFAPAVREYLKISDA
jgi:8-oxo-dGTP pyrophosphatase MutT (NUDIX family)